MFVDPLVRLASRSVVGPDLRVRFVDLLARLVRSSVRFVEQRSRLPGYHAIFPDNDQQMIISPPA
jgi:hypothetical protein